MYPLFLAPQAFAAEVHGLGSTGFVALHTPLQFIAPTDVAPQAFAAEVQAVPYPGGRSGTFPEQVPSH